MKNIYLFSEIDSSIRETLGKNACEMIDTEPNSLGFVLTQEACAEFYITREIEKDLRGRITAVLDGLCSDAGVKFGESATVSIFASTVVPMPGILEKINGVGLNESVLSTLPDEAAQKAWALHLQLMKAFACEMDVSSRHFTDLENEATGKYGVDEIEKLSVEALRELCAAFKNVYAAQGVCSLSTDPYEQFFMLLKTAFRSWDNPRACVYRRRKGITDSGLSIAVQLVDLKTGKYFKNRTTIAAADRNNKEKDASNKSEPQGEFKRIEIDGDLFEGYFINGKKNGRGKYTWANGDVYDGMWKDGKRCGRGRISWSNGASFDGEWHDGKKHGRGTYTWADGTYYEGEFADGNFNGFGKKVYSSGDVYEGQWKDDKRTGHGTYTWTNGDTYEGELKDGKLCGRGKLIQYGKAGPDALNAGEVFIKYSYDGEWLDNREHGHGICREGNGTVAGMDKVYEGEWVNGKKCGRFVWHFLHRDGETGKSYIDFYEDGKLVETCIPYDERIKTVDDAKKFREAEKRARISAVKTDFRLAKQLDMNIVASVGYYNGDYMNGERNGYGECAYDNGDKYIGTWKDGAANGVGRYAFARGGFYFGQFSNGRVDGYGVYFDGNDYHIGVFENGECVTERDLVFEIGSEGKWLPLVFESDESIQIYGDLKKPSDSIMKYSEGVEYSSSARMWVASFNENLMVMGKVLQKGGPINDQNGVFIYTNHADGLVATGEIRNSMLNGRVTIRYITGETVEADCVDNKPIETYHSWDKFGREVW